LFRVFFGFPVPNFLSVPGNPGPDGKGRRVFLGVLPREKTVNLKAETDRSVVPLPEIKFPGPEKNGGVKKPGGTPGKGEPVTVRETVTVPETGEPDPNPKRGGVRG